MNYWTEELKQFKIRYYCIEALLEMDKDSIKDSYLKRYVTEKCLIFLEWCFEFVKNININLRNYIKNELESLEFDDSLKEKKKEILTKMK